MRGLLLILLVCSCSTKEKAKPEGAKAFCALTPRDVNHATKGKLDLREVGANDVEVSGAITGLAPDRYSVHLHRGNCAVPPPNSDDTANHAAELGVITADSTGLATLTFTIPNARLGGPTPLTGRHCLIVYTLDLSTFVARGGIYSFGSRSQ